MLTQADREEDERGADHLDVRLLSDEPIRDPSADYFGFATFASALAEIIDNAKTDTPLTIALSAPWGAGKTSVAQMMQAMLERRAESRDGDRARIICRFNAWDHDDAPHLGAALAAQVARTANHHRPLWRRIFTPLPAAMLGPQQRWWRIVKIGLFVLVVTAALVLFHATRKAAEEILHLDGTALSGLGWLGVAAVAAALWTFLFGVAKDTAKFIDEPSSEAARGAMASVKQQLGGLIRQAIGKGRLVIIVDDLERCRASRAVEVFEVASQLLSHQGVVTVLLADMSTLEKAASTAYGSETHSDDQEFGRHYLEKLVQLQLELPPPQPSDMTRLLKGEPPRSRVGWDPERSAGVGLLLVQEWSLLVGLAGLAFTVIAAIALRTIEGSLLPRSVLLGFGASLLSAIVFSVSGELRSRQRKAREEVERRVTSVLEQGAPETAVEETVAESTGGDDKLESVADQVKEEFLTVRSSEIAMVEAFIDRYPPPFPRSAKRMLNHARLLTKIARDREMFGGSPDLTPAHLGKWIVIRERWPLFAEAVARDYRGIVSNDHLERLNRYHGLERSQLGELLRTEPELLNVIERLIYFVPARSDPHELARVGVLVE